MVTSLKENVLDPRGGIIKLLITPCVPDVVAVEKI
jgi:hypothetical protein